MGGTNYYIESILWNVLVDSSCNKNLVAPRPSLNTLNNVQAQNVSDDSSQESDDEFVANEITFSQNQKNVTLTSEDEKKWEYMSGAELHEILKKVDPKSALRLHPNNKRKIMRYLFNSNKTFILYKIHIVNIYVLDLCKYICILAKLILKYYKNKEIRNLVVVLSEVL